MEKASPTIRRVAILGAESTGKTTLARSLAVRYHTHWVPEYSREYMARNPGDYTADDIVRMTKIQVEQENELLRRSEKILFADTELIIAKVWCEDVFGFCPEWIAEALVPNHYDLYLLTANDLPWVPDPVRVNPQRRGYFYEWYRRELEQYGFAYEIISGRHEMRLFNAIQAIEKHFGTTFS